MQRREYTKDGRDFIIERFDSFSELLETCEKRPRNFGDHVRSDGSFDDPDWIGCETFKEATDLLKYGWEDREKIQFVKNKINQLSKLHDTEKIGFYADMVGFAPIVPNAILGIPEDMLNTTRKAKKAKVITIIVEIGASACTSWDEYLEWGARLIGKIIQLEKNGFRVRLEHADTFANNDGKVHAVRTLMKSENQPFDIKRYMFPLAHTAMLRGISFNWYERLPNAVRISGYGMPLHALKCKDLIKREISNSDNCYFICFKENIEEALKDVK